MHLHGGEFPDLFSSDNLEFVERLRSENLRLSQLAHTIARKQAVIRDAMTRLRLGVSVDAVAVDIVEACRRELADLDLGGDL
jgi:hypothetical protein